MDQYTEIECTSSMKEIDKLIKRCESMLPKFELGSSQHSLLINRIFALKVSRTLIGSEESEYSKEELLRAYDPIVSIISKTTKARSKHDKNSVGYQRMTPLLETMDIAKEYITNELNKVTQ